MEALYLISSIVSNGLATTFLSLRLLFKSLLPISNTPQPDQDAFFFYQGQVLHVRSRPRFHSFRYPVRYALVNLDLAPPSFLGQHIAADDVRRVAGTAGPVFLLTIPPSVGYEQNPLSVYYCFNADDSGSHLAKCIAEVTNTPWGERVSFVFNPDSDTIAKPLHVSPFMDMQGNWRMRVNTPGEDLSIEINVEHPELGDYFTASLKAKRVKSETPLDMELFFWLMPHKVALWIYWQALKLWWKGVSFLDHPKYQNPAYREEAIRRDQNLQCPVTTKLVVSNQECHEQPKNSQLCRSFTWGDAPWPWS